jgi:DNA-directed RNA polymerase specialized sigma subunit
MKRAKVEKKQQDKDNSVSIKKSMREMSLQEIGDELGLTRMRICQLEKSILEKIRSFEDLSEF